jgi:hypothetical protein
MKMTNLMMKSSLKINLMPKKMKKRKKISMKKIMMGGLMKRSERSRLRILILIKGSGRIMLGSEINNTKMILMEKEEVL